MRQCGMWARQSSTLRQGRLLQAQGDKPAAYYYEAYTGQQPGYGVEGFLHPHAAGL